MSSNVSPIFKGADRTAYNFAKWEPEGGLSKRELFAAMAMEGLLSASGTKDPAIKVAQDAAAYADALIAELTKVTP
jgi:hypothetical protein